MVLSASPGPVLKITEVDSVLPTFLSYHAEISQMAVDLSGSFFFQLGSLQSNLILLANYSSTPRVGNSSLLRSKNIGFLSCFCKIEGANQKWCDTAKQISN